MLKRVWSKCQRFFFARLVAGIEESLFTGNCHQEIFQRLQMKLATSPIVFGGELNRVKLGENVKIVNALMNVSSGTIFIGDHSFFGHNVSLITGTHEISEMNEARQDFPRNGRDITIGRGVWIASNAIVLGPCIIEDNVVVAAGAVVTGGLLERNCLYAGVPARKVKEISLKNI